MFSTFEKIKELAKSKGVSLQTVATDLGFSVNYIYSIKNKKNPSVEHISKIANYFNVSTDYLLGNESGNAASSETSTIDLSNLRDRVVLFDGKPLSDDDVKKIAQIIELSLGVDSIDR